MKTLILLLAVLFAGASFAAECTIIEYDDHVEAICIGDPSQRAPSPRTDVWQEAERKVGREQPPPRQSFAALEAARQRQQSEEQVRGEAEPSTPRSHIARRHAEQWLAAVPRL